MQPLVVATWRAAHRPGGQETRATQAARAALLDAASRWPLPVTLQHVLRPLLLLVGEHPAVALLLVDLGAVLGDAATLQHLVPALLQLLLVDGGRPEAKDCSGMPCTLSTHKISICFIRCAPNNLHQVQACMPRWTPR